MQTLELREYQDYFWRDPFNSAQLRALGDARIGVAPSPDEDEVYILRPSSWIGTVNVGDIAVVVRPKIPIDRVMFLITYAMGPENWRRESFGLQRATDVLEAVAFAFAHHTRQAIQRGLLQGYRREEDALTTVRGRIRFGDQIARRFGIPLPIEVAFDEFTEDIEENRLLKTAIHRLGYSFIRSPTARRDVRRLRPAFATVGLGSYGRGAPPEVRYTRLNEHYRPAVELARLIIEDSSLELFHGKVEGAAFLINMNEVFERFLYVALGEALGLSKRQWKSQARLDLDEEGQIEMKPDLSWWDGPRPLFVGDAKYKKLESDAFKHADIYQMLAYCTAANLRSGLLVYAKDESEPRSYRIKHADKTIEVTSLDLSGAPDEILAEVRGLADRVRSHTYGQPALRAA